MSIRVSNLMQTVLLPMMAAVLLTPANCQIRDVVKSAEIDAMFARTTNSLVALAKNNYSVVFRVAAGAPGAAQNDPDADEFWFVRRGTARVSLGASDARHYDVQAGAVVSVPRTTPYQIAPAVGRFEYVAVRVFPTTRRMRIGIGAAPQPHPMPDVATKAQIDATFARADKNVLLHSSGAVLINHVVYNREHGPWEVHETCDDLYFVRMGTAYAQIDGTLVNGKEDPPGEIRGTGVTGSREYSVAPGDMVVVPRNTAHFMDPAGVKLGYLLVKVCD